jgi:gluconokinase
MTRGVRRVVIMGVSGSGKTAVGSVLAVRPGWRFIDADALHPPANIAKMTVGIPLTDQDRGPGSQPSHDNSHRTATR